MKVEYRDVEGFPGYRVGSDGTLWSCKKRRPRRDPNTGRLLGMEWYLSEEWVELAKTSTSNGYLRTILHHDGKRINKFVHNLVCEAFHGARPEAYPAYHAAHDNGDPLDNRASNLSWKTPYENNWLDQVRHGTHVRRPGASVT